MDIIQRTSSYIRYWLDKVNHHSLHSPFLYDLYTNVIRQRCNPITEIENLRAALKADDSILEYYDHGALRKFKKVRISELANKSLSTTRFNLLYFRLVSSFKPNVVVELGTSLGINTLYLASAGSLVKTLEGAPPLVELSRKNFQLFPDRKIEVIAGNIDDTLPELLQDLNYLPFVFFDANHTYEATVRYFEWCLEKVSEDSVFIFDDIHWSKDMERAWAYIKNHPLTYSTFDLYQSGIVFFKSSLTKQHFSIDY